MSITYELLESGVAVLTFDDGKANALSPSSLTTLSNLLDRCAEEANSVVLVGREGVLSAGFDLKIMTSGGEAAAGLVTQGCNVLLKLYEHPQPVVIASPGHAVAGGAVLMLCGDHRVSAEGDYKIGLNEVRIGLPMPIFVSELVRERVTRSRRGSWGLWPNPVTRRFVALSAPWLTEPWSRRSRWRGSGSRACSRSTGQKSTSGWRRSWNSPPGSRPTALRLPAPRC